MIRLLPTLALIGLLLFSYGCDEDPAFPAAPQFSMIEVTNSSGGEIATMRYREYNENQNVNEIDLWSRNLLSDVLQAGETLHDGFYVQLRIQPGRYDFKFEDEFGNVVDMEFDVRVNAGVVTEIEIF